MEFEHHDLMRNLLMNRYKKLLKNGELQEAANVIELAGRMGYFDMKQLMLVEWDRNDQKMKSENDGVY